MSATLLLLASTLLGSAPARAEVERPPYLLRLMGGLGGGAGPGSGGGHGVGRALLQGRAISGDFGIREGLYSGDLRSVGALFFGLRWTPEGTAEGRFSTRLGLAHHHEVPFAILKEEPVASAFGTAKGIRHRTGVELGGGWRAPIATPIADGRIGLGIELSAGWLPDQSSPPVYGFVDLLLTADLFER